MSDTLGSDRLTGATGTLTTYGGIITSDGGRETTWERQMAAAGWMPRTMWEHDDGFTIPPDVADEWKRLGKTPPPW